MGAKANLLILGGTGMLGHKLFQFFRGGFSGTVATTLADVHQPPYDRVAWLQGNDVVCGIDVTNQSALKHLVDRLRPEVVINCVGVIKQRGDATRAIPCISLNALFPHQLAEAARATGSRVVHISTDCVFSGRKGSYTEADFPDANDLYGRTKLLGELEAAEGLTLRTSIIGRELFRRTGLLEWFLSQRGGAIKGFAKAIYSGTTTIELGRLIAEHVLPKKGLAGLYQVASAPISKYDLLKIIDAAFATNTTIVRDDVYALDRSLNGSRFREETGYVSPPWAQLVEELRADTTPYDTWHE